MEKCLSWLWQKLLYATPLKDIPLFPTSYVMVSNNEVRGTIFKVWLVKMVHLEDSLN